MPVKIKRRTKNATTKPTMYNTPMVDKIIKRILEGESLKKICSKEGMPCLTIVYKWMDKYPEFAEMYRVAKELQMDTLVDEMLDISRDCIHQSEAIQKAKLVCDTIKWQATKLRAKKYGEKFAVTGEEGKDITIKVVYEGKPV